MGKQGQCYNGLSTVVFEEIYPAQKENRGK